MSGHQARHRVAGQCKDQALRRLLSSSGRPRKHGESSRLARLHVESEWVPKDTDIDELELAIRENCEPMLDRSIKDVSLSEVIINLFDTARKFKLEVQPQYCHVPCPLGLQ